MDTKLLLQLSSVQSRNETNCVVGAHFRLLFLVNFPICIVV